MKKLIVLFSISFLIYGCNKNGNNQTYCWQLVDPAGNLLEQLCNMTEDQLTHCSFCGYPADSTGVTIHSCMYYIATPNEAVSCWILNGRLYKNVTLSYVNHMKSCNGISTAVIADCNTTICKNWYCKNVNVSKTTGDSTVYQQDYNQFCGDTLNTLFTGRLVKLYDTKDSVYYREFIHQ